MSLSSILVECSSLLNKTQKGRNLKLVITERFFIMPMTDFPSRPKDKKKLAKMQIWTLFFAKITHLYPDFIHFDCSFALVLQKKNLIEKSFAIIPQ
jgi:hypothetical protein